MTFIRTNEFIKALRRVHEKKFLRVPDWWQTPKLQYLESSWPVVTKSWLHGCDSFC